MTRRLSVSSGCVGSRKKVINPSQSFYWFYNCCHLHKFLSFCKKHQLWIEPTPDTLSYYIIHFISPDSADSYLLGIVNQLEPYYADIWKHQGSLLVRWALKRAWRSQTKGVHCKAPLSVYDLDFAWEHLEKWLGTIDLHWVTGKKSQ